MHLRLRRSRAYGAHDRYTRVEPCDWTAGAHGVTTMLGVSLRASAHNSSNVGGVTAGQVRHNSSKVGGGGEWDSCKG